VLDPARRTEITKRGIRQPPVCADPFHVIRSLGFVSLVAAVSVGGYLASAQLRSSGPTGAGASTALAAVRAEAGTVNLQQAALALEQHRAATGGYAAAQLGGFGVVLRSADAGSYCVETVRAPMFHLAGPDGTAAAGSC
jgi:hypothetical protein